MFMSGISALAGFIMIIFAFLFTQSDVIEQMEKENPDIKDGKRLIFIVLVIFAAATILVAVMGFCFSCVKNRCFAVIYGLILLPTWIVVIFVGGLAVVVSVAAEDEIKKQCQAITDAYNQNAANSAVVSSCSGGFNINDIASQISSGGFNPFSGNFGSTTTTVTISLDIYDSIKINDYMCSKNCPCAPTAVSAQWTGLDAATARLDREIDCYPWDFTGTVKTYKECITDITKRGPLADLDFQSFADSFKDQPDFDTIQEWIEFFENQYDCAGICKPSLFSWSQSID